MKKTVKNLIACTIVLLASANAHAFDLKDLIPKSGSGSSVSDVIGGLVDGVLSTDKLTVADIAGTWNYADPSVSFKSDNLLKKAGGAAAATAIETKLSPFYKKAGLEKMVVTINDDKSFTIAAGKTKLSGTVAEATDGSQSNFTFNFKAFGKMNIGKVDAYVVKGATGSMSLMFDVSKLIQIARTAGSLTGNSSIKSITAMLESYDGLCAGFKLKK